MTETARGIRYEELVREDRVHGSLYHDPAIFEDELEKIWHSTWVYVGHESEISQPGDYVTKKMGLQPIIMSRDEDGQVHLLMNRCVHRANMVVNSERGHANAFRCPYHGWTYSNSGEALGVPYRKGYGESFDRKDWHLARVPRMESYRGFVFGCLSESGASFDEYLGAKGKDVIDRLVELSPEGEIELGAGWLKHYTRTNWKMVLENETDGYHPRFVHQAILKLADSQLTDVYTDKSEALVRALGGGHTELDLRPAFRAMGKKFRWFGGREDMLPGYVEALEKRHGKEKADALLVDGSPHVMLFPNLFIAEIFLMVIQPVSAGETIQYSTPIFFKGAPDLNKRILRQAEGSIGPAGLLLADDSEMYERNFRGVQAGHPEWLVLSRGLERERTDEDGHPFSNSTDETSQRAIWRHYKELMVGA